MKFSNTIICLMALLCCTNAFGQNPNVILIFNKLQATHQAVVNHACVHNRGMIVSDRGLNVFFANKIGSYLSDGGDISLFKNYATLDASDGIVSINSNLFVGKGSSGRIKSLFTLGAKANIADGFAAVFSDKKFSNELGLSAKYTFFGRGTTKFDNCGQTQAPPRGGVIQNPNAQKDAMSAKRALILHTLHRQMETEAADFEASVSAISSSDVAAGTLSNVQAAARTRFYAKLDEDYQDKFAEQEGALLSDPDAFKSISTHWTTIQAYIPVTTQKFHVAPDLASTFVDEDLYPWKFTLSHSRIWESQRNGRFFFFGSFGAFLNNAADTKDLQSVTLMEKQDINGELVAKTDETEAYVGVYRNFVTPQLRGQGVWFPKKSNVGISILIEKNFGTYDPLNGKLGIPIRLNDKDGKPSINLEIQLKASDLGDDIQPDKSFSKKASVGISVGFPFASLLY